MSTNEYCEINFHRDIRRIFRSMKTIRIFYLKTFSFLVVQFSIYLNRPVFVMG